MRRVTGCPAAAWFSFALQYRIQCVDDRYVRDHHQMGVVSDRWAFGIFFTQTSGVHLERRAEIRLGNELVIDRTERRRCRDASAVAPASCALAMLVAGENDSRAKMTP